MFKKFKNELNKLKTKVNIFENKKELIFQELNRKKDIDKLENFFEIYKDFIDEWKKLEESIGDFINKVNEDDNYKKLIELKS